MADLVITAANVLPSGSYQSEVMTAGEVLTAGMSVYKNAADANKAYMAQRDGTAAQADCYGITLGGASPGQPVVVMTGGDITIGAAVVAATIYIVGSGFGGIAPAADIASTNLLTIVGYAIDTAIIRLFRKTTGIIKA